MRIMRVKLQDTTLVLLDPIAKRTGCFDKSFVEDCYCLVRSHGNGLPAESRVRALVAAYAKEYKQSEIMCGLLVKHRAFALKRLIATPIFQSVIEREQMSDIEKTELIIGTIVALGRKVIQSQCMSCNLLNDCGYGKKFGRTTTDITMIFDPASLNLLHKECPEASNMPFLANVAAFNSNVPLTAAMGIAIDQLRHMSTNGPTAEQVEQMEKLMEEAEMEAELADLESSDDTDLEDESRFLNDGYQSSQKAGLYAASNSGSPVIPPETFINSLTKESLLLQNLMRKLDSALGKEKKGKFKPSPIADTNKKNRDIKSVAEVGKVITSQQALPDEIFEGKLTKKQLTIRDNLRPEKAKQLMYLLIDVSDSMTSSAGMTGTFSFLHRSTLCTAICCALTKHVGDEGGIIFARMFEGGCSSLYTCRTPADFTKFNKVLRSLSYNGSSTNVTGAVDTAIEDIRDAKDELARCEILMITDATVSYPAETIQRIRNKLGKIIFNVIDVSARPKVSQVLPRTRVMIDMADNYYNVHPDTTPRDLISLVASQKKKA